MSNKKANYYGSARFIELGTPGQPFRSLINIDHVANVRYEQQIEEHEIRVPGSKGKAAEYDVAGQMTSPPILPETRKEPILVGWLIAIIFDDGQGQKIAFNNEQESVNCYNSIVDMIAGTSIPIARLMVKLKAQPPERRPSILVGADGAPFNDGGPDFPDGTEEEGFLPGEDGVPMLTEAELDQLENPEIDIDAIANAVKVGVGDEEK